MDLVKSQNRHLFSGKESDFPYFCEIFEARMFILKLHSVLEGTAKSADYVPKDADPNDEATKEAAKKKLDEAEAQVYYELMMHLEKKTALKSTTLSAVGVYCSCNFFASMRSRLK